MSFESLDEERKTEVVFEVSAVSLEIESIDEGSSLEPEVAAENIETALHRSESEELCTKYVSMSQSSVLRHAYYNYPAVLDPGIKKALLEPRDEIVYPNDGQQLYVALCRDMDQCPVRLFYKGLLTDSIDLKYYGVNPSGVKAMAMALQYNRNVTVLDLTDNHLHIDACFHLGEMLKINCTLRELKLSGSKIGASGAKQIFAGLSLNRSVRVLNLNGNDLEDTGVEYLTAILNYEITVEELYLSRNNITGKALGVLAEVLEIFNKLTVLDLSWNSLSSGISGTIRLINCLSENKVLQDLNLSWNSLASAIGAALKPVFKCPMLRSINLSNNKFQGQAIENIIENLGKAKKLVTMNLSHNPLSPKDAIKVVQKLNRKAVKVKNILMDGVNVTSEFLVVLKEVKAMEQRLDTLVTYGTVIKTIQCVGPDMRDIVLNRAEYLTKSVKRNKTDIALWAMQLLKGIANPMLPGKTFADLVIRDGLPLNSDLVDEIVSAFSDSKNAKEKSINVASLVDYIHRKWPDRKLPPTPPPELEPEIVNMKQQPKASKGKK